MTGPNPVDNFAAFRNYWLVRTAHEGDEVFTEREDTLPHEAADPVWRARDRLAVLREWRSLPEYRSRAAAIRKTYADTYRARYWYWRLVAFFEPPPGQRWPSLRRRVFTALQRLWAWSLSKQNRDLLSGNGPDGRDLGHFYGKYPLDRVGKWRQWHEWNGERYGAPARRAWKLKPSKMRFRSRS